MIKSTMNQLGSARNKYQGSRTRVLCVCSAGLLRSPSLALNIPDNYEYMEHGLKKIIVDAYTNAERC